MTTNTANATNTANPSCDHSLIGREVYFTASKGLDLGEFSCLTPNKNYKILSVYYNPNSKYNSNSNLVYIRCDDNDVSSPTLTLICIKKGSVCAHLNDVGKWRFRGGRP